MFRKLLIIGLLFSTGNIYAQPNPKLHPAAPPTSADVAPLRKQVTGSETDYKAIGAPAPDFILRSGDGKLITNKDVRNKANLFIMIFNPTCGHCEDMTDLMVKNKALFSDSHFLMVATPGMEPYIPAFRKDHKTADMPQMQIGLDSLHYIDKIFLYKMLPQINIYDRDRKLIKVFSGDTPIDSLKPYIQ